MKSYDAGMSTLILNANFTREAKNTEAPKFKQ